ncbi:MAG: flippase-like domain-containing protein [Bacteroidales bacterium]|jgi:uncharacterized protein (TIRG00374 family)|nr:flippase-like domain-containing protein [Bacteroidales bacterium]
MKKYIKDILKLVIFLALGVFFIWLSLKDLTQKQIDEIWQSAANVLTDNRWLYLVLCALIGFISVIIRAIRSVLMIEPLGYKVSKSVSYHAVMICYLANMAITRLGEVLRCSVLQRYEKVPFEKSLGTVITERVIDTLIFGLMMLATFFLEYDKIMQYLTTNGVKENVLAMLSGSGKYILLSSVVLFLLILWLLRKKIKQLSVYQKIIKLLKGFWEGLISIRYIRKKWLFILYSFSIWLCYYLMFFAAVFAFDDLRALGGEIALASLSCVAIGTIGFAVAQGGLGAYPLLVSGVLLLYGINKEVGLAAGWVIWATEEVMYVVLGLVSLAIIAIKKSEKKEQLQT